MNDLKITLLLFGSIVLSGCGKATGIREYEVPREEEKVLTSELLRDKFQAVPFRWTAPKDWEVATNDQFSAFAWTAGPKNASARITISELAGEAGVQPQFVRWRGQLKLPEMDPAEVMKSVEKVSLKGLTGDWVEFIGDSESILGMIVPFKGKLWIFKYRSANSTAKEQRDAFRGFCESLTAD